MKVAFSYLHPDRVIASIRKAGGGEEEPGEKIGSSKTQEVRRGVSLAETFVGEFQIGLPGLQ